jgi:hypothetical protein
VTAANLIVCERAAYLLTDSATYRSDGTIIDLQSKVVTAPELRIAIASAGEVWDTKDDLIREWIGWAGSADKAVGEFPTLVALLNDDLKDYYRRHGTPMRPASEWPPQHVFRLVVAIWSAERRQPEGYAICSRGWLPQGPTLRFIQPPEDGGLDFYSPDFDPERDGLALLEAQRRFVDAYGGHIVGGTAQLTTVTEASVSTVTLKQWPDEIGRPITPACMETAYG